VSRIASRGDDGSDVRIIDATGEAPDAWDAFAVRSPRGEALQSHAWLEIKRETGWDVRRYRVEDADGPLCSVALQERELLAPLARRLPGPAARSGALPLLGGRFLYAPMGPVLVRDDAASTRLALAAMRRIARRRRAALLVIDPNWVAGAGPAAALADTGFTPSRRPIQVSTTGMFVPLLPTDAEQRSLLNENARRNVDRARKSGATVRRLDATAEGSALDEALATSYRLLVETGRRVGFAEHLRSEVHHNAGQRALIRSGAASLWMAEHEGRDVAHTVVHHSGRRAVLFQAGEGHVEGKRVPANFLLQWEIIRWAAAAGFKVYDMGGVDNHEAPGIPADEAHPLWSLFRFKSQWGAQPVTFAGAHEHAPWPALGWSVRTAWGMMDRLRERRQGGPSEAGGSKGD
jgi:lipid II:glycine glycyltransferase (peptidoglycan interpeptide bridge formation enzyme)